MRFLYSRQHSRGKVKKIAKIYEEDEHCIRKKNVDNDVVGILRILQKAYFDAYIVGGAVRDLLIGRSPKDFDLVTNARPKQVCALFRRARIIGKRFTIVLLPIKNQHLEISTFRSINPNNSNEYGSIYQDVYRRDFTCNGLYYCPIQNNIIDFVDGMQHIQQKKLIPIYKNYAEDPIRMLRAIKFSVITGFSLSLVDSIMIFFSRKRLLQVSSSRRTEEFLKIIISHKCADILIKCFKHKLLKYMIPTLHQWFSDDKKHIEEYQKNATEIQFAVTPESLKQEIKRLGTHALLKYYILAKKQRSKKHISIQQYLLDVKEWLHPLTLPNADLKMSIKSILSLEGNSLSKEGASSHKSHRKKQLLSSK